MRLPSRALSSTDRDTAVVTDDVVHISSVTPGSSYRITAIPIIFHFPLAPTRVIRVIIIETNERYELTPEWIQIGSAIAALIIPYGSVISERLPERGTLEIKKKKKKKGEYAAR